MPHFTRRERRLVLLMVLAGAAGTVALGCRPAEQIQTYTVPKEPQAPPVAASSPADAGALTDRMLVAISPDGSQAWFFKVVGPAAAVDKRAEEFTSFFTTIRPGNGQRAQWVLPHDWREEPATGMRAATLWIPTDDKPLELSVAALPWTGAPDELLHNVNRWRGQLQLPEIGPQGLAECTRELKAGDAKITIVDLRGRFQGSGMTAPFANGAVGAASRAARDPASDLPAGHPPIDQDGAAPGAATPPPAAPADVPKFEVPDSWQQSPAEGMRKAVFSLTDGEQKALVTVIDFAASAGPAIADPLQNVNQWRRAIGLPDLQKDALQEAVESIEIDGRPAHYAKMIPDATKPEESQVDQATLAAMVTSGDRIWFIKMTGSRNLVAAQQEQFKNFLKSIRFAGDGASDGN